MRQPRFTLFLPAPSALTAFLEFSTMLSCAELAAAAWGRASTPLLTPGLLARLASIAPAHSVLVDEPNGLPRSETSLRSASELGGGWLDPAAAEAVRSELRRLAASVPADVDLDTPLTDTGAFAAGRRAGGVPAGAVAYPLLPQFAAMPVRVMSMRAYDAGDGVVGKAAYSQAQRNWAAAEHSMMALLAADGARTVYPCLTHTGGFAQTSEIVAAVREVVVAAALLRGRDALPAS